VAHALLCVLAMKTPTSRFRPFQFVLFTLALSSCAAAVDEAPSEEVAASSSEAVTKVSTEATLDADVGCDAAPAKPGATSDPYKEFTSILDAPNISVDAAPAGSLCTRMCACCKRGNRFCCSHCDFCSGPIKVTGGVLAR
jgi:hypothetical protein